MAAVGGNILVGAYADDPGGVINAGSAYLFDGATGALLLTIPNPAPGVSDNFGVSVAGVGGNILIGAYFDDPGGVADAGSAYLFDSATGALLLTIPNPAPAAGDDFGLSVAGVGGSILVGAYQDDPGGVADAGSAYLFDGATGDLLLTIPNPAPAASDKFGEEVAGVGGSILVGAYQDDPGGVADAGSAYLFDGATGDLLLTIPNPTPGGGDNFGISVAAVGGNILVGADGDDPGGVVDAGSAYLFCPDGDGDGVCDGTDNCPLQPNPGDVDCDRVGDIDEPPCESDPLNGAIRPERIDGLFAGVSDDGDASIDEALPAGAANFDCDGDGYKGVAESGTRLCGNGVNDDGVVFGGSDDGVVDDGCPGGPGKVGAYSEAQFNIGLTDQDPCGTNGWPSDFVSGGIPDSTNWLNILDVVSFIAPDRRLDTSPGHPDFKDRWDLAPGRSVFTNWINVTDLTSLIAGSSGNPPMLGGVRAFNGPACPWAP